MIRYRCTMSYADIVPVASLGNAPTGSRVRFDPVRRGNELIDKQLGVVRYVAGDIVVNVVEICRGNVRPPKSHSRRFFAEMRRFISS